MNLFGSLTLQQTLTISMISIALRYIIIAGGAYVTFYYWKKAKVEKYRIQKRKATPAEISNEIAHSIQSIFIFGLVAVYAFFTQGTRFNHLYFNVHEHSSVYLLVSLAAIIIVHDTYFYWMHRLMHLKKLYLSIHRVHHRSVSPTPLAAFSFHFTEALMEAFVMVIILAVIPVHYSVILIFDILSFSVNAFGHLGYEFAPSWWIKNPLTKWITTSTYHNIHHSRFTANYGFYFTFWDKLMGTEDPNYASDFNRTVTRNPSSSRQMSSNGLEKRALITGASSDKESI